MDLNQYKATDAFLYSITEKPFTSKYYFVHWIKRFRHAVLVLLQCTRMYYSTTFSTLYKKVSSSYGYQQWCIEKVMNAHLCSLLLTINYLEHIRVVLYHTRAHPGEVSFARLHLVLHSTTTSLLMHYSTPYHVLCHYLHGLHWCKPTTMLYSGGELH